MKQILRYIATIFVGLLSMQSCSGQIADREVLKAVAAEDSTQIIDVRTVAEYEDGHIEGSINIPLDVIKDSAEDLKKYKKLILVCRSGGRSEKAKNILEAEGVEEIYNGGGWSYMDAILKDEK